MKLRELMENLSSLSEYDLDREMIIDTDIGLSQARFAARYISIVTKDLRQFDGDDRNIVVLYIQGGDY